MTPERFDTLRTLVEGEGVKPSPRICSYLLAKREQVQELSDIMVETFESLPLETQEAGWMWYRGAKELLLQAQQLSGDLTLRQTAALCAALSQRTSWDKNQRDLLEVCAHLRAYRSHALKLPGLPIRARNMMRVIGRENVSAWALGPKLGAFAQAMLARPGIDGMWVHDSHMAKWLRGAAPYVCEELALKPLQGGPRLGEHWLCWLAAEDAALKVSIQPISAADLQAAIWCHVRGGAA